MITWLIIILFILLAQSVKNKKKCEGEKELNSKEIEIDYDDSRFLPVG